MAADSPVEVLVPAGGTALADALASAPPAARLRLATGTHIAGLELTRSVTLLGEPGVVLQAPPRLPVLWWSDDGLWVRLEHLQLQGGVGGGVRALGRGRVQVADCRFIDNRADVLGGGGLYARSGWLTLERCAFEGNRARVGGGVLLEGTVRAEFLRCDFLDNTGETASALWIDDGAQLSCKSGSWRGHAGVACVVGGTRTRSAQASFDYVHIRDGDLRLDGGAMIAKNCQLPDSWRAICAREGSGNIFGGGG